MMEKLEQLQRLLRWKESNSFMANKLGVSLEELANLKKELKSNTELIEVDKDGFEVKVKWIKDSNMSVMLSKKKEDPEVANEEFKKFLASYKPAAIQVQNKHHNEMTNTCLVVNKQDAHLNKLDVAGDNNMSERFVTFYQNLYKMLLKATITSNLQKVIYVLGSDEFNSEFHGRTTHDTPQQNIGDYYKSFEAICAHEISIINLLQQYSDSVHIMYIPGNHDENVGWHLVNWIKTYYRNCANVLVDDNTSYTKYIKYSNTAMCFNHGYIVKPEMLAQNFPIEFKAHWSACDNFYIFTGDKHTELSRQIGGIKFYRLAQISKAKSKWDMERGYIPSKGELTAFLIEEGEGLTDIYHQSL